MTVINKCFVFCEDCNTCLNYVDDNCTFKYIFTEGKPSCKYWIEDDIECYPKCKNCLEFVEPNGKCLQTGLCKFYNQYFYPNHICDKIFHK